MQQIVESLARDPGVLTGTILGAFGIFTGLTISVTAIIMGHWRKVRQTEDNNALKHALLEHGMSAEEIATVVNSWPGRRKGSLSSCIPKEIHVH
jgi:hypothetical protein